MAIDSLYLGLQLMLPAFSTCCDELMRKWDGLVDSDGSCELDVWHEFVSFAGDVISRTAFGSNFREGQRIFELQAKQAKLFVQAAQHLYIPGYRYGCSILCRAMTSFLT